MEKNQIDILNAKLDCIIDLIGLNGSLTKCTLAAQAAQIGASDKYKRTAEKYDKMFHDEIRKCFERMQKAGIKSGTVYCHPLMSIDGDHGHNDMAGDDDAWDEKKGYEANDEGEVEDTSWKMYFSHNGYTCDNTTMIEKGLLELPTIRAIWINHTKNAIAGEPLDYYHSKNPEE